MTKEQERAAKYVILHNADTLSDVALREVIQILDKKLAHRKAPSKREMDDALEQAKNLLVKASMDGCDVDDKLCVSIMEPRIDHVVYTIPLAHIVESIETDVPVAIYEYEEPSYDNEDYGLREAYVSEGCPKEYREQFNGLLKHLDIYDITDRVRD